MAHWEYGATSLIFILHHEAFRVFSSRSSHASNQAPEKTGKIQGFYAVQDLVFHEQVWQGSWPRGSKPWSRNLDSAGLDRTGHLRTWLVSV